MDNEPAETAEDFVLVPAPIDPVERPVAEETVTPPRSLSIPNGTLPLFAILFSAGAIVLLFAFMTVHRLDLDELNTQGGATRTHFSISHWLEHGYFSSYGLLVRQAPNPLGYVYYKSSTGGHLVTAFIVEKVYAAITGHPSWKLLAIHNQIWTLLVASVIGLLGFRLARRFGMSPLHALAVALSVEIVHFTFPENLLLYFEMNGRPYFLFFAVVFLLIEERCLENRTRALTYAQAAAAFLLAYMEYVAGATFIASYVVVSLLAGGPRPAWRRLIMTAILPLLFAYGVYGAQRSLAKLSGVQLYGSEFLFRTGLDGSSQYYGDHLDIALGRDVIRQNYPNNQKYMLRWTWLFLAGAAAVLFVVILAMRGRVPIIAITSLISLLGTYLLYAALFSQAIFIHPYLFDVLLFTPLTLALFVLAPALLEKMTEQRGVAVVIVVFVAVWVSMVQMRRYAMIYPRPAEVSAITMTVIPRHA